MLPYISSNAFSAYSCGVISCRSSTVRTAVFMRWSSYSRPAKSLQSERSFSLRMPASSNMNVPSAGLIPVRSGILSKTVVG